MDEGRMVAGTPEEWLVHARWVRALARALVRDDSAADDVVQDTWLAALRRAPRASGPVRPWLARIVRNVATDRARAETRRTDRESAHAKPDSSHEHAPDEIAESIETQKLLLSAVERLQDPLRSAVVRRYFHGKTSLEIAREDGVAESTVRERIDRGLQALRRDLDARHRGDRGAWMAVLTPIARRADAQLASAGATATGIGVALGITWKIVAAALVVVAALVGARAWTRTPEATAPLAARTTPGALDTSPPDAVAASRTATSRESATGGGEVAIVDANASSASEPDRVAWVEAHVVDESGAPIGDAELACTDRVDQHLIDRKDAPFAKCTADGRVRLELHLRDSPNHGRASDWADTIWDANVEVHAADHAPHRADVQLDQGRTSSLGTVVLVRGGTIAGRVVDERGEGLPGAKVHVVTPDMTLTERDRLPWNGLPTRSLANAKTAKDGTFELEGIPVGLYCVWTATGGRECAFDDRVRVLAGETAGVQALVMREDSSAIRGTLVDAAERPVSTEIRYAAGDPTQERTWKRVDTDVDGRFVIDVVPETAVDIYCDRGSAPSPSWVLRKSVPAGTRGLVLRLKPLPIVDMLVQDEQGAPIAGWDLDINDPAGGGVGMQNMRAGHAKVPVRGPPFTLGFRAMGFAPKTMGPYDADTVPPSLVVTLERQRTITCRVTGDGRPLEWVRIYYASTLPVGLRTANGFPLRLDSPSGSFDRKADGTFEQSLPEGESGTLLFQPWSADGEDAPDGFARAEVGPLDLRAMQGRTLDVELHHGGRLEGRVLGFDAASSTMSFVSASWGDTMTRSTRIRDDGSYSFDHMAAGEWLVRPTERDYTNNYRKATAPPDPANVAVRIVEGKTAVLDLSMPKTSGATLDGALHWPGAESGEWTAHLVPPDAWNGSTASAAVAADGTFHLEAEDGGRHHLSLRMTSSERYSRSLECDVDLAPGPNRWELTPALGAISVASSPVRDLELECRLSHGVTWTAQWRTSGSGGEILPSVPQGRVILRSKGRVLAEVDVAEGETANVVWN